MHHIVHSYEDGHVTKKGCTQTIARTLQQAIQRNSADCASRDVQSEALALLQASG